MLFDEWENIKSRNKVPFIFDCDGILRRVIDFAEFKISSLLQRTTKEEFLEKLRKAIVFSLKNFVDFFKDAPFWVSDVMFVPKEVADPNYYRKYLLTEEEDVDTFGNKGLFSHKKDFKMCILANGDRLQECKEKLNIPWENFEIIKIIN